MNRIPIRLAGALIGVSLLGAACGAPKGGGSTTATSAASTTTTLPPGNVDAADLRSKMTALLQENVFLTAMATQAIATSADPAPALAAREANAKALQDAFTSIFGAGPGSQFGTLWRRHLQSFLDYAKAKVAGDTNGAATVKASFDPFLADLGTFFDTTTNGNIQQAASTTEVKPYVTAVLSAIDAQAAKKATQYDSIKKAADKTNDLANVLVVGFQKGKPGAFRGDPTTGHAVLRSELTLVLEQHVYLAGLAIKAALSGGDATAASATLDANSANLANVFAAVYGDDARQQVLALWRKHIGFFVDYAKATAAKSSSSAGTARSNLDQYRADFGALLESLTKGRLTKSAVSSDLAVHVSTLSNAIDAIAANDPSQVAKLSTAAQHMDGTATTVADALADQFPTTFAG